MKVAFHPEALAELQSSAVFYEQRQPGLGDRFVLAVEDALQNIQQAPERWGILDGGIRRKLTRIFPYALLYSIEPESILILAVMHCHQKPGYWRARTPN